MSYMLPHLDSGYAVDQAILSEEDRVVIIRFGHDWDPVQSPLRHPVLSDMSVAMARDRAVPATGSLCLQPATRAPPEAPHVVVCSTSGPAARCTLCGTRLAAAGGPSLSLLAWQSCMKMDETLYHVADKIKNFAVVYVFTPSWSAYVSHVCVDTPLIASRVRQLFGGHLRGARLQHDVRVVRPGHSHVFLQVTVPWRFPRCGTASTPSDYPSDHPS
jgi:hypothetical protein